MLPASIKKLTEQFNTLPGIGPKTATRLAFFCLKKTPPELERFADAIKNVKTDLKICGTCLNIAQTNPCSICSDPDRDKQTICVVAENQDQQSIERTGEYKGLYHILGGVLNPLEGVSPQALNINQLLERLRAGQTSEVILGLNPDLEGESTAMYLQKLLSPFNIKITRLAKGLPSGADIEYADEVTLASALKNRREL